jgi:hypothetical protein
MLRAAGIAVTDEGKAAARRRRLEAAARWTPGKRAELRKQLGLPADARPGLYGGLAGGGPIIAV